MRKLQLSSDRQRRLAATDWHLQKLKAQKNAQAFKADEEKKRAAESIKKLAQAAAVPEAMDTTRAETHFSHVKTR